MPVLLLLPLYLFIFSRFLSVFLLSSDFLSFLVPLTCLTDVGVTRWMIPFYPPLPVFGIPESTYFGLLRATVFCCVTVRAAVCVHESGPCNTHQLPDAVD